MLLLSVGFLFSYQRSPEVLGPFSVLFPHRLLSPPLRYTAYSYLFSHAFPRIRKLLIAAAPLSPLGLSGRNCGSPPFCLGAYIPSSSFYRLRPAIICVHSARTVVRLSQSSLPPPSQPSHFRDRPDSASKSIAIPLYFFPPQTRWASLFLSSRPSPPSSYSLSRSTAPSF